jgi:hypothetical protein
MERNVQRINGNVTRLHHLSDDELEAHMGYAHARIDAAAHDLELLGQESARRFAIADLALQDTVELPVIDANQGQLFHFPTRPDFTPPDAA